MADEFVRNKNCDCSLTPIFGEDVAVEWRDSEPIAQEGLSNWDGWETIGYIDAERMLEGTVFEAVKPIDDDQLWDDFKWVHDMTSTFQLEESASNTLLELLGDESWAAWNFLHDGGDIDGILEVERAYGVTFE